MELGSHIRPELIFPALDVNSQKSLLRAVAKRMAASHPDLSEDELYAKLLEREELESTAFGEGVAIPHCKVDGLEDILVAVAVVEDGIDFGAVDGEPVRVFFCIVSSAHSPVAHLQCLATISRWVKSRSRVQGLLELETADEIYAYLNETGG